MTKDFYLSKVKRKKADVWAVRFRHPETGKIMPARSLHTGNATLAEKRARELYAQFVKDAARPPMTLKEWAAPFFTEACPHVTRLRAEGRLFAEYTRQDYRRILTTHILPDPITAKRLDAITRGDALDFRDRLVAKLGPRRIVQRALTILRVIFREAIFRERADRDPLLGVRQVAVVPQVRAALTLDQLREVVKREHFTDEKYWLATVFTAATGMRAGEVRALQWQDIDGRIIHVRRALKSWSGEMGKPKWGKLRNVPLSDSMAALLGPPGPPAGFVFSHEKKGGEPLGYTRWAAAFKHAARAARVPAASLHSLRHTLNTLLRERGVSDEILRATFGWSGPAVQEGYTHRDQYETGAQAAAVEKLLGGPPR